MTIRTRVLATVLALTGCTPTARPREPVTPEQAVAALRAVRGMFTDGADHGFALMPHSAVDASVIQQIAAREEGVVPALIECLADASESRVEYRGAPTSLGAVCFWTLLQTQYVQERLTRERSRNPAAAGWVSYQEIEPQEQLNARKVWRAWYARQRQEGQGERPPNEALHLTGVYGSSLRSQLMRSPAGELGR